MPGFPIRHPEPYPDGMPYIRIVRTSSAVSWQRLRGVTALFLASLDPMIASAASVACQQDPTTLRHLCFDKHDVKANGMVRASPFFSGGPISVQATGHFVIVDCARQKSALQDHKGSKVPVHGEDVLAMHHLGIAMCEAPHTGADPSLRIPG